MTAYALARGGGLGGAERFPLALRRASGATQREASA
jgi:hypothetical protein